MCIYGYEILQLPNRKRNSNTDMKSELYPYFLLDKILIRLRLKCYLRKPPTINMLSV